VAFDQIRSHSILADVFDGAEPLFCVPAPPARLCDRCSHTLAKSNKEDICFCCQRHEAELKTQLDGLRASNNGNRKPVQSERRWDYDEARAKVAC
jgi:hypothetical protein